MIKWILKIKLKNIVNSNKRQQTGIIALNVIIYINSQILTI